MVRCGVFDLDLDGVFDEMLSDLSGGSVIDGNAKYLVGAKGEQARAAEQAKLDAATITE